MFSIKRDNATRLANEGKKSPTDRNQAMQKSFNRIKLLLKWMLDPHHLNARMQDTFVLTVQTTCASLESGNLLDWLTNIRTIKLFLHRIGGLGLKKSVSARMTGHIELVYFFNET